MRIIEKHNNTAAASCSDMYGYIYVLEVYIKCVVVQNSRVSLDPYNRPRPASTCATSQNKVAVQVLNIAFKW